MEGFSQRIAGLILKHLRNELEVHERLELDNWIAESGENADLFDRLTNKETLREEILEFTSSKEKVFSTIEDRIAQQEAPVIPMRTHKPWKKFLVAASILLAITVTMYMVIQTVPKNNIAKRTPNPSKPALEDITPGGNRAVLQLSDGSVVVLEDEADGLLTEQGGTKIVKLKDGELEYQPATGNGQSVNTYNTLSTSNGTYQVRLPDGSKVWLNALSSIKYPTVFSGSERRVEITGEAYFEVAHITSMKKPGPNLREGIEENAMPFIVQIKTPGGESRGEVKVLGTHFNINAYNDEPAVKTTLLEGKVKVSMVNGQWSMLKPGQQSQIINNKLSVINKADTEEVMAWKNGFFQFSSDDLQTILRQAARWYNIEVSFPDGVPADKFSGPIPRNINLGRFLSILEMSEVKYSLEEGRQLTVLRH